MSSYTAPENALAQVRELWAEAADDVRAQRDEKFRGRAREAVWTTASQHERSANLLRALLASAYGAEEDLHELLTARHHLVRDVRAPNERFVASSRILESLEIGCEIRWDRAVVAALHTDLEEEPVIVPPLARRAISETIESTWFPGGSRQLAEVINRDPALVHLAEAHCGSAAPAARLVLAAAAGGDLSPEETRELLLQIGDPASFKAIAPELEAWLVEVEAVNSGIESAQANQLRDYLRGHRVLLVEDRYEEEHWDLLLPTLLGGRVVDAFEQSGPASEAQILVVSNSRAALEAVALPALAPDLVLLDLYSSRTPDPHLAISRLTMSDDTRKLIERLREKRRSGGGVPETDAAIIVLSGDLGGYTVRSMLREFGADDYVFKRVGWGAQKPSFYSTFRNAIVGSLMRQVVRVLALPDESSAGHARVPFVVWLRQFLPAHRPQVLAMMRHFRYYSASAIVKVFDRALDAEVDFSGKRVRVLECPERPPEDIVFSYLGFPNKSGVATLHLVAKSKLFERLRSLMGSMPRTLTYEEMIELVRNRLRGRDKPSPLTVILVDDVIGSGGQTADYLGKYVVPRVENLGRPVESGANDSMTIEPLEAGGAPVDIRLLFAVGWPNKEMNHRLEHPEDQGEGLRRGMIRAMRGSGAPYETWRFVAFIADWLDTKGHIRDIGAVQDLLAHYSGVADCRVGGKDEPEDFEPLGWKECAGLLATYANVPGNVPPVVWGSGNGWKPLFPRFFNQFVPRSHARSESERERKEEA